MARQNKLTRKPAAQPATPDTKIEQFKNTLFESLQTTTPLLTVRYANWLEARVRDAQRDAKAENEEAAQHRAANTLKAWERSQELFAQLTPIVLNELMKTIAAQVAAEFEGVDAIAASDVSFQLRDVSLFDLMEYTN